MSFSTPHAFTVGFRHQHPSIEQIRRVLSNAVHPDVKLRVLPSDKPNLVRVVITPPEGKSLEFKNAVDFIQVNLQRGLYFMGACVPLVSPAGEYHEPPVPTAPPAPTLPRAA